MKFGMVSLILIFISSYTQADTTIINDGCVKYLATGKVYNVEVRIVDGEDLWPKASLPGWNANYSRWVIVSPRDEIRIRTKKRLPTTAHFHIQNLAELEAVGVIRGEIRLRS